MQQHYHHLCRQRDRVGIKSALFNSAQWRTQKFVKEGFASKNTIIKSGPGHGPKIVPNLHSQLEIRVSLLLFSKRLANA